MAKVIRHLDLFSGIGGFALGLESTGFYKTVAFCEIEAFPRKVLRKHWPGVPCYEDIRELSADRLSQDGIRNIGILTGGFPCQDLSLAGKRAGLSGQRSSLWTELSRVITEVRPAWAIIENVPGLRTLGGDRVLSDLARADYAAWPLVVGAIHAGAPHRRQRVWIIAHAVSGQLRPQQRRAKPGWQGTAEPGGDGKKWDATDSASYRSQESKRKNGQSNGTGKTPCRMGFERSSTDAPDSNKSRLERHARQELQRRDARLDGGGHWQPGRAPEPVLRGMDDGLPCGMDRRKRITALGNAVVPQIVAAIGRSIGDCISC